MLVIALMSQAVSERASIAVEITGYHSSLLSLNGIHAATTLCNFHRVQHASLAISVHFPAHCSCVRALAASAFRGSTFTFWAPSRRVLHVAFGGVSRGSRQLPEAGPLQTDPRAQRKVCWCSRLGSAAINLWVYGWRAESKMTSGTSHSTISPSRRMAIRWQSAATERRSCDI